MNFVKDKSLYYRVLNTSIKNKNIKQQKKNPWLSWQVLSKTPNSIFLNIHVDEPPNVLGSQLLDVFSKNLAICPTSATHCLSCIGLVMINNCISNANMLLCATQVPPAMLILVLLLVLQSQPSLTPPGPTVHWPYHLFFTSFPWHILTSLHTHIKFHAHAL